MQITEKETKKRPAEESPVLAGGAELEMPAAPDAELSKLSFRSTRGEPELSKPSDPEPAAEPHKAGDLTVESVAGTVASRGLNGAIGAAGWGLAVLKRTVGDMIEHPDAVPGTMVMGAAAGAFTGLQVFGITAAGILAPAVGGAIVASVGFYAGLRAYEWVGNKISSLFSSRE